MRVIKFRGRSAVQNEWVYGTGIKTNASGMPQIYDDQKHKWLTVHTGSVGQYIGVDLDEAELYEGALLRFKHTLNNTNTTDTAEIIYFGDVGEFGAYPAFDLNGQHLKHHHFDGNALSEILESGIYDIEIVGNSFENEELIAK